MDSTVLTERVRTAHGDAWQEQGRLRIPYGGAFAELPGIRLMASGLQHPQWNNADVTDAAVVDIDLVREWYAARGVPWGARVPNDQDWSIGRHLFAKRLMGLTPEAFVAAPRRPPTSTWWHVSTPRLSGETARSTVPGWSHTCTPTWRRSRLRCSMVNRSARPTRFARTV